mmetsp:Transcript_32653/g.45535  ORF Transcript_32653/g.45535 Transcript_32653/m.45535 type:complete len:130 (+) Transcript_32653:310-699(+)
MTRRQLLEGRRSNEQFQIEIPERWISTTCTSDDERELLRRLQTSRRWRRSLTGEGGKVGGNNIDGSAIQSDREGKKNKPIYREVSSTGGHSRVPFSSNEPYSAARPATSFSSSKRKQPSKKKQRTKRRK